MTNNPKVILTATMPECRCIVAYHVNPLRLYPRVLKEMIGVWLLEGFVPEILTQRAEISARLGCIHRENWPRNTHATPVDAREKAGSVLATIQVMQALSGDSANDTIITTNDYYSYICMYNNPLVTSSAVHKWTY